MHVSVLLILAFFSSFFLLFAKLSRKIWRQNGLFTLNFGHRTMTMLIDCNYPIKVGPFIVFVLLNIYIRHIRTNDNDFDIHYGGGDERMCVIGNKNEKKNYSFLPANHKKIIQFFSQRFFQNRIQNWVNKGNWMR